MKKFAIKITLLKGIKEYKQFARINQVEKNLQKMR